MTIIVVLQYHGYQKYRGDYNMKYIALIIFILAMVLAINWMRNDIDRIKQDIIYNQLNSNYNLSLLEV